MIPKTIHYCWFGGKPLSASAQRCIDSWRRNCPDYKIIEWNEQNFNICTNSYVKEAYEAGKFAFVADYVRLHALYHFGGIYMDTDVEVIREFDDLLDAYGLFGFEQKEYVATSFMAAEPKNNLIKEFWDLYENEVFQNADGSLNTKTNVERLTDLLVKKGLKKNGQTQEIEGNIVCPKEYFSPYDYINCVDERTDNTYCIHWFEVSWLSSKEKLKKSLKKCFVEFFGKAAMEKIRRIFKKD